MDSHRRPANLTLALAVSQPDRLMTCVELACQLGVERLLLYSAARSYPDTPCDLFDEVRRVAHECAQKAGLEDALVEGPCSLEELAGRLEAHDAVALCWEAADMGAHSIPQVIGSASKPCVIVGPVDGFVPEEVSRLVAAGAVTVTLGETVLDVEAAVAAAVTLASFAGGELGASADGGSEGDGSAGDAPSLGTGNGD